MLLTITAWRSDYSLTYCSTAAYDHVKQCMFVQGLPSSHKGMPMALCQIVAHEVNLENIRRKDKVNFAVVTTTLQGLCEKRCMQDEAQLTLLWSLQAHLPAQLKQTACMHCTEAAALMQARLGTIKPNLEETQGSSVPSASQEVSTSTQDKSTAKLQLTVAQRMKEAGTLAVKQMLRSIQLKVRIKGSVAGAQAEHRVSCSDSSITSKSPMKEQRRRHVVFRCRIGQSDQGQEGDMAGPEEDQA